MKRKLGLLQGQFVLLAVVSTVGCGLHESPSLTTAQAAEVQSNVLTFTRNVARDINQEGPAAWRRYLGDSPAFFMASGGHLVFPNRAAATPAIDDLVRTLKKIELTWGDDLRVDPLTAHLAMVASSYHEIRVSTDGSRVDETGFFTGTAEHRDGRWQFRNIHWSVAVPPPAAH